MAPVKRSLREKGARFEIYLEELFRDLGCKNVTRNVQYHQSSKLYRQVDVEYTVQERGKPKLVIVEAKFTSKRPVPYLMRNGTRHKAGTNGIDNLLQEHKERKDFTGARYAILATNRIFEPEIYSRADRAGIKLLDGQGLQEFHDKLGRRRSVQEEIDAIRYDEYLQRPLRVWMRSG